MRFHTLKDQITPKNLAYLSLAFWLLSLTLPFDQASHEGKLLYGFEILMYGIIAFFYPLIWLILPWHEIAVISNFFYLFCVYRVIDDKTIKPGWLILITLYNLIVAILDPNLFPPSKQSEMHPNYFENPAIYAWLTSYCMLCWALILQKRERPFG